MTTAQDCIARYRRKAARRDQWRELWQRLADVFDPEAGGFATALIPGRRAAQALFDSTPQQASRGLATAIDGLLKPSTSQWFWLESGDAVLDDRYDVKLWLDDVRDRMWRAIYSPTAGFIQASGAVDRSLAVFGLGYLWISETRKHDDLMFRALSLTDVAFEESADGQIDSVDICRRMTARQAEQKWGRDNLGPKVIQALEANEQSKQDQLFEFVQCIMPRDEYDPRVKTSINKPFASVIVCVEDETVVEESGYDELPLAIPRWEVSPGEIYPRSPGMVALADGRTLQAMGRTILTGAQRAVDPPTWVSDDAVLSAVRTWPGGLTVVSADAVRDTNGHPIGQLDMAGNLPIGREMQQDVRGQVEAAFFKNVFNLPIETHEMTATEVMQRKEEFLRTIGPTLGQLESNYIGAIVTRVFGIMMRALAFPPAPPVLQGRQVQFRFMSPIQQARKQIEAAGMSAAFQFAGPLIQAQPDIIDNFNGDEIVRDLPDIFALPNKWLRSTDDVAAMRKGRAQVQQIQETMDGTAQAANIAKTAAQAGAIAPAI